MKRSREPQDDINPASPDSPDADIPPSDSQHTAKYTELDLDAAASDTDRSAPLSSAVHMVCSLPPHADMAFDTYTAYEAHYTSFHTNRCLQCRKNFPSQHLLGVHIEEMHDPIVRVQRDQGVHTVYINLPLTVFVPRHRLITDADNSFLALSRAATGNA